MTLIDLEAEIFGLWNFMDALLWVFDTVDENHEGKLSIGVPDIMQQDPNHTYKLSIENDVPYVTIDGNKRKVEFPSPNEMTLVVSDKKTLSFRRGWK